MRINSNWPQRTGNVLRMAILFPVAIGMMAGEMIANEIGEQIYRANCYSCHGVDPAHDGPLGPAINDTSRELLLIRLKKGGRHYPKGYKPKRQTEVMPPQAHLIPQIDDLLAYLNLDHSGSKSIPRYSRPTNAAVARGKEIFVPTCGACHQPDGRGKPGFAPSLTDDDFLSLASADFIKTTIKQGRPGTSMIPFAFLTDDKINDIVAYILSFQRKPARIYDHQWVASGNREDGQQLYETVCSQCHGDNGKGYLMGGSGTGIGLNGFLSVADDGYIKQIMLSGREGSAMRAFGGPLGLAQLSDQDMNNIIVYLRYLGKKNAGQQ